MSSMFPIVQNLNSLANSIHQIKGEVQELRASIAASANAPVQQINPAPQPAIPQGVIDDIKSVASQTTQGMADVRRHVDTMKAEISREMGMMEAMILRKSEMTLNKMINDKINIALDAQRSSSRDAINSLREEMSSDVSKVIAINNVLQSTIKKLEADVNALKTELDDEREAATSLLGSGVGQTMPVTSSSNPSRAPAAAIASVMEIDENNESMDDETLDEIERMISSSGNIASIAAATASTPSKSQGSSSKISSASSKINKKSSSVSRSGKKSN